MNSSLGEDDELRRLLSDLDPMPTRVPVESVDSPQARHRLEQIMQNTENQDPSAAESSVVVPLKSRRRPLILAAAASIAVLGLGTAVVANMGGGGVSGTADLTVLALKAPGGDATMQMCMRLDAEALKPVPVALAGTVIDLGDKTVTLDVDRWYKGGTADQVTITLPPGDISPALIPGVEFTDGGKFLVTAFDGVVSGCGFSGPATADLQKLYDEAFGG